MRASSAVLTDTSIRLWDLNFPASRVLLARTRSAYVHVDNLIAFSKRDRDGKVDAYLAAYLPDELVLLFFEKGDLVNAAMMTPVGRFAASISEALRHIRTEPERAELAFHEAPQQQLAAMFATCTQATCDIGAPAPESVFKTLFDRKWSGLLELISNGRVNYLSVRSGRFASGLFSARRDDEQPMAYITRLFAAERMGEPKPAVSVKAFEGMDSLPLQAPPAMLTMFRRYVWDLAELAATEVSDALQRSERVRMRLVPQYDLLRSFGGPRGSDLSDPIAEPAAVADAIAAWTRELLQELEIVHPQIAPRLLRDAGREHRFALSAVGFFERLPWRVQW
jgi:hypothetical protein